VTQTINEKNIRAFAECFEPPLKCTPTQRVNGVAYPNAWNAVFWDAAKNIGVTCVAYEGQLHAYIEATGRAATAQEIGRAMAQAMGRAANG
jgi:hypothetical protein